MRSLQNLYTPPVMGGGLLPPQESLRRAPSFKIRPFIETLDEARDPAYAVLLKLAKVTGVLTFSKVSSEAMRDKRFL